MNFFNYCVGMMPDLTDFINTLFGTIGVQSMLNMLVRFIVIGIPFITMWFGVRKLVVLFSSAVFTGKINFEEIQRKYDEGVKAYYDEGLAWMSDVPVDPDYTGELTKKDLAALKENEDRSDDDIDREYGDFY